MAFKKAKPEQAYIKMAIYGPQGSGKTFTSLLFAEGIAKADGKRIAFVDSEHGSDFYAMDVKDRSIHPDAFDFDALYTRSLSDILESCKALDPKKYSTIVIDSMSHLWDSAIDAYTGKRTSIGQPPLGAWSRIKAPYKAILKWLIESPYHVFILGRQKNLFETDENDNLQKVGVTMRAEGETQYEPHICLRLEPNTIQEKGKPTIAEHLAYIEKDRTGILQGRILKNPTFEDISPIMALLGGTQAQVDDEDERIAADSELLDDKEDAKFQKSKDLFTELQTQLFAAKSNNDLMKTTEAVKKKKRYLLKDHQDALREAYKQVQSRL